MNAWIAVVLLACIVLSAAMLVRAALHPVICPDCRVRLPRPAWRWKMPGLLERWVCPACGCQIDRKGKKYTPLDQQEQPPPAAKPNAQTKQTETVNPSTLGRPTATDSPAREIRPDTPQASIPAPESRHREERSPDDEPWVPPPHRTKSLRRR